MLLTHGHADHVWDTAALLDGARDQGLLAGDHSGGRQVPVYVPQPDLYRLDDPDTTTGIRALGMSFADMAGTAWRRPEGLRPFPGQGYSGAVELVPGLAVRAVAAPGHSEGSCVFFVPGALAACDLLEEAEVLDADPGRADEQHDYLLAIDGDVIFKGSVGRTDLPGGDQIQMWATLRFLATAISPSTVLLPGHGAVTTMEHELRGNPYLAEARIRGGDRSV